MQLTIKQKILAWVLIIGSYIFTYLTPMVASYYLLAEEQVEEAGKGGAFFWMVISISSVFAIVAIHRMVNRTKANMFKSFFKGLARIGFITLMAFLLRYVNFNLGAILNVIWITIGGSVIGVLLEMTAVGKYRDYIREVGVL